jgi:3-methyladenine DNA glycosylase AlkD
MTYKSASQALQTLADSGRARTARAYFKNCTQDVFLGITTPQLRRLAGEYWEMKLSEIRKLMQSQVHEERSLANEILRIQFRKSGPRQQKQIFDFYVKNRKFIREWDGVDGSAPYIVGPYLLGRSKKLLYEWARSPRLWDRRIAIVSTLWFIRQGEIADTLKLAQMLLEDDEDLIHKATGWMLREVGKQDSAALKKFLNTHCAVMPRTMLRYAIERFPEPERKMYMSRRKR